MVDDEQLNKENAYEFVGANSKRSLIGCAKNTIQHCKKHFITSRIREQVFCNRKLCFLAE